MIKKLLKYFASLSPIALTKNEHYDRLTEKVIKKTCKADSVCVDVGANNGKILSMFIKHCPKAVRCAFEPIEDLYFLLVRKYGSAAQIFKVALSDKQGISEFHYMVTDNAYSSLQKQKDFPTQTFKQIEVQTDLLDNIVTDAKIDLIKVDIEGGEYDALIGAQQTIIRCKPVILFEFGKGGSDAFGVNPEKMYNFFTTLEYSINFLNCFLRDKPALSQADFSQAYEIGKEYFFVASPRSLA